MNLNEIRASQIEDKYCNKLPDYRQHRGVFDFNQRVILLDHNDFIWLLDKVKELSKDKDTEIQNAKVSSK